MQAGAGRDRSAALIYVVDDDASVREALSALLRSNGWQVRTFASAVEFLADPRGDVPACLVLDVRMPVASGLELQRQLAEHDDPLPIIFMTGQGDIPMSVQAMKAGAVEFLPKPFRESDLLAGIELALERDAATRLERAERTAIREHLARLSAREHEVMMLIVEGRLNKQVAAALGITEFTIKAHRRRVMEKMGAASLPELVRMIERVSQA